MKLFDKYMVPIRSGDCILNETVYSLDEEAELIQILGDPIAWHEEHVEIAGYLVDYDQYEDVWVDAVELDNNIWHLINAEKVPSCKQCRNFFDCLLKDQLKKD